MHPTIIGRRFRAYDASTLTRCPAEARLLLMTDDLHTALQYARERGATVTVYAYDLCDDGALINRTFVYHLALI
jgi:hypothetical protein